MSIKDYSTPDSWNEIIENEIMEYKLENETRPIRRATKEKMKTDCRENSSSRKKQKPNAKNDTEKTSKPPKKPIELETDTDVLQRRQKQIDYGKNTVGYHNYMHCVPIEQRTKDHPKTPDKFTKYSRRSWDKLIKMWRIKLHEFDSQDNEQDELSEILSDSDS